ncbi:MAG: SpoIIE family protein phosphatase [Sumerlaeia bacterium]
MASNSSFVDKHAYFKSLPAALAPREVAQNLSPREDVEWMRGDPIVMQTQVSQHFSDWFKKAAEAQGWDFSDARLTSIYWSDRSNDPVPAAISRTVRAVAWGVMFFFIPLAVLVAWRITRRARYLSDAVDQLAAGNYNVRVPATGRDEIGRLGRQFNHMVEALEDREKLRSAIRVAAQLQAKLLPEAPQDLPNLDIAAANRMCERIGGDYYDFVRKNGDLWIVAGDISGHGLEAGLLMSAARANVRLLVTLGNDPLTVLKKLNRRLVKDFAGGYFLTLALMKVNLQTLEYEHVSAGHEPTLLLSNGDIHRFQTTCPPLGLFKELPCKRTAETGRFHKGDRLLMSTDGLRECFNANEEELGHGPIHETLRREGENANELTRDFMDLVERHRDGYEFQDDLTLVMVNITGEGQDAQANLIEEEAHALVSAPV